MKIQKWLFTVGKLETLGSSFSNETALAGCLSPSFEKSKTITDNILFIRKFINEWKHKKLSIVAPVKEVFPDFFYWKNWDLRLNF